MATKSPSHSAAAARSSVRTEARGSRRCLSSSQTLGLPHRRGRIGVRGWAGEAPSGPAQPSASCDTTGKFLNISGLHVREVEPMVLERALQRGKGLMD